MEVFANLVCAPGSTGAEEVFRFDRGDTRLGVAGAAGETGGLSVKTTSGPNAMVLGRASSCVTGVTSSSVEVRSRGLIRIWIGVTGYADAGGVEGRSGAWTGCVRGGSASTSIGLRNFLLRINSLCPDFIQYSRLFCPNLTTNPVVSHFSESGCWMRIGVPGASNGSSRLGPYRSASGS